VYENTALDQESLQDISLLLQSGHLEAVSHQQTNAEFLEARQVLYEHDAERYPNYFIAPSEALRQIGPTVEKAGGTTARLSEKLLAWSSKYASESLRFSAGPLVVAPYVLEALLRREQEAITYSYFRSHMGDLANRPSAEFTVRRTISLEYTRDYLDFLDADLATGIRGVDRFDDELSRFFPQFDLPLLGLVLYVCGLSGLVDLDLGNTSRWQAVVAVRDSIEHSLFTDSVRALLESLTTLESAGTQTTRVRAGLSASREHVRATLLAAARGLGMPKIDIRGDLQEIYHSAHQNLEGLALRVDMENRGFYPIFDDLKRGMRNRPVDVLLVTSVDTEEEALERALEAVDLGLGRRIFGDSGVNSYRVYGPLSGATLATIRTGMGADGASGSHQTVADAIYDLQPSSVISVGIAFGIDEGSTPIGTLLLSSRLFEYDAQRIGTKGGQVCVVPRGATSEASARLLDRFRGARLRSAGLEVRVGLLLSGSKLVDNVDYRNELINMAPEAIGGEMEGSGVRAAAGRRNVDWIIAKAVSDFADGQKRNGKKDRQRTAADNACRAVVEVIRQGGLYKVR